MKKKILLLLLAAALLLLPACGATAKGMSAEGPVRIAGLKGPTTMGLVNLLDMEQQGTAALDYDLQLYGTADEIVPGLIKGELDMAAIPANLAAALYQKTKGGIQVMAVNTLGVLYVVEKGILSIAWQILQAAPSFLPAKAPPRSICCATCWRKTDWTRIRM